MTPTMFPSLRLVVPIILKAKFPLLHTAAIPLLLLLLLLLPRRSTQTNVKSTASPTPEQIHPLQECTNRRPIPRPSLPSTRQKRFLPLPRSNSSSLSSVCSQTLATKLHRSHKNKLFLDMLLHKLRNFVASLARSLDLLTDFFV